MKITTLILSLLLATAFGCKGNEETKSDDTEAAKPVDPNAPSGGAADEAEPAEEMADDTEEMADEAADETEEAADEAAEEVDEAAEEVDEAAGEEPAAGEEG